MSDNYIRIIPKLDIKGPNLVKGVHLEGLRVLGKPEDYAYKYYQEGADELIYLDLVASLYGRSNLTEIVKRTAQRIAIPLTVGGGIKTIEDIQTLLSAGADKVAINTALFSSPELISQGARRFGSQCIVVYIEAKKMPDGEYLCLHTNAREATGVTVLDWAKQVVNKGAGEILLTSVDQEGTGQGLDLELIEQVSSSVPVPVIANGGAGTTQHLVAAVEKGKADAVCAASIFHYNRLQQLQSAEEFQAEGNTSFIQLSRSNSTTSYLQGRIFPTDVCTVKNELNSSGVKHRAVPTSGPVEDWTILNKKPLAPVVIVNYEMGNLFSLQRAIRNIGAECIISNDPETVSRAKKLILPGVGAFGDAMKNLENMSLKEPILDCAKRGTPLMGICLGMQLLFSNSDEFGQHKGLDIIPGKVETLFETESEAKGYKLPHIGWNTLHLPKNTDKGSWEGTPFQSCRQNDFVYFVHTYRCVPQNPRHALSETEYGKTDFCSAVWQENVTGCQFHPELSGDVGLSILSTFVSN